MENKEGGEGGEERKERPHSHLPLDKPQTQVNREDNLQTKGFWVILFEKLLLQSSPTRSTEKNLLSSYKTENSRSLPRMEQIISKGCSTLK